MAGDGIIEGKKGIALYLTPRAISASIKILYMVCMVTLAIFAGHLFVDSLQEIQALVESGDVPKCIMTMPVSGILMLFAFMMILIKK